MYVQYCHKHNLNLGQKSKPVLVGADATVSTQFLGQTYEYCISVYGNKSCTYSVPTVASASVMTGSVLFRFFYDNMWTPLAQYLGAIFI